jgi:hypothetical protein
MPAERLVYGCVAADRPRGPALLDQVDGALYYTGSFWMHRAKHAHYGWTGEEGAIVQIHFIGPGGIEYVNPADDPRTKN